MILNLILIAIVYCKNCTIDFNYKNVQDNGYTAYAIRRGDIICNSGECFQVIDIGEWIFETFDDLICVYEGKYYDQTFKVCPSNERESEYGDVCEVTHKLCSASEPFDYTAESSC